MTKTDNSAGRWWDWHLFGLWVLVNAAAFAVVPLVGVLVEQVASTAARNLAQDHRALAVVIIAVIGAALQGIVVGRWQWRLLQRRLPGLERRRWVTATVAPAFFVWLLAIAPEAVDLLAKGGNTLTVFRNGFIQALVLGPLIGLSQATTLRGHTSRWGWWAVGNVTTYLTGAAAHVLGGGCSTSCRFPRKHPPSSSTVGRTSLIVPHATEAQHCGQPQSGDRKDFGCPRCLARAMGSALSREPTGQIVKGDRSCAGSDACRAWLAWRCWRRSCSRRQRVHRQPCSGSNSS